MVTADQTATTSTTLTRLAHPYDTPPSSAETVNTATRGALVLSCADPIPHLYTLFQAAELLLTREGSY